MNIDAVMQQLRDLRGRAELLSRQAAGAPADQGALPAMLNDLWTAVEELQAAEEELRWQDDTLTARAGAAGAALQHYQELFLHAPDAYILTNTTGVIREANVAAAELLGLKPHFLTGKPLAVFVANSDRYEFRSGLNSMTFLDRLPEWELALQPRRREPLVAAVTVSAVRDANGELTGLRWLLRDISRRKQLEQRLHDSDERYRDVIDNAFEAIFQVAVDGRLLKANGAAASLLGYPSAAVLLAEVDNIRGLYVEPDACASIRLSRTRDTVTGFVFEALLQHRDGYQIPASMNIRPAFDTAGQAAGADVMILRSPASEADAEPHVLVGIANADTAVLELLQVILEEEGFDTVAVQAGQLDCEAAFAAFVDRYRPQALVWDFSPPYRENWVRFQKVRELAGAAGLAIVVTTTNTGLLEAVTEPGEPFVTVGQPFDIGSVARKVGEALYQAGYAGELPPPKQQTALAAIFNPNEAEAVALRQALESCGLGPVSAWSAADVRRRVQEVPAQDAGLPPRVVVYDIAPPYLESWALFQVARKAEAARGCRFVLTTPNRRVLEQLVGPTDAIELTGLSSELREVTRLVRVALDGAGAP